MKNINILLNLLLVISFITTLNLQSAARSSEPETKETTELINSDILIKAIKNAETELVYKLVEKKQVNLNYKDSEGFSALYWSYSKGYLGYLKLLLDYGADVNIQNNDGWTVLMFACSNAKPEVVKLLLEYDADTKVLDNDGLTALDISILNGHNFSIFNLIEDKEIINIYIKLIFKAYEQNHIETCKMHLKKFKERFSAKRFFLFKFFKNEFLLLKNKENNSLLHLAVIKMDYDFIDYILKDNPEIVSELLYMPNKNRITPIDLAVTDKYLLNYFMEFAYPPESKKNGRCIKSDSCIIL